MTPKQRKTPASTEVDRLPDETLGLRVPKTVERKVALDAIAMAREREVNGRQQQEAVLHPDANPRWDTGRQPLAPDRALKGHRESLEEFIESGRSDDNLLDDTIYKMRLSGMDPVDIAARLGPQVNAQFVHARLNNLEKRRNTMTPAQYRWLQIGRMEAMINMIWPWIEGGSVQHIDVALKAMERVNKMFELERESTVVQVEIVSEGQAELMKRTAGMIIDAFMAIPGVREAVDEELLLTRAAEAFESAAMIIDAPDARSITIG